MGFFFKVSLREKRQRSEEGFYCLFFERSDSGAKKVYVVIPSSEASEAKQAKKLSIVSPFFRTLFFCSPPPPPPPLSLSFLTSPPPTNQPTNPFPLFSKHQNKNKQQDNINLFSVITILSFFLLAPVTLVKEGVRLTPSALTAAGVANPTLVIQQALAAAACFHAYQQVSYMILARVSPVTHSIGNCVKRVIVIVASVVVFRNPMGPRSLAGTAIALGGVFLYSQVKRSQNKKAAAAKAA